MLKPDNLICYEEMILDAERRIGSYIASTRPEVAKMDSYVQHPVSVIEECQKRVDTILGESV